jgi:uncharacterized membrane-anchored protein YhcB (DUF1043 family)
MMFGAGDVSATELGTFVFAAALVLGVVAVAVKAFVRKPPLEAQFATKKELEAFKHQMNRDIESLRGKVDQGFERMLEKLDENKTEILNANERRSITLHERLNEHEGSIARLDERSKR